jgi:CRP-like cAMP-binding protein
MASACYSCTYQKHCVIWGENEKSIQAFSDSLLRYSIAGRGRSVFNQGELADGVYLICRGVVKLVRLGGAGEEIILEVLGPASIVGQFPKEPKTRSIHGYSAITASELVEVSVIPMERLLSLLESYPSVGYKISHHISVRLHQGYDMLANMKFPVRDRILRLLGNHLPGTEKRGRDLLVKMKLSRGELAQMAQTTPETVSRTLQVLEREGAIRTEKDGTLVLIGAKLERVFGNERS